MGATAHGQKSFLAYSIVSLSVDHDDEENHGDICEGHVNNGGNTGSSSNSSNSRSSSTWRPPPRPTTTTTNK